MKKQALHECRPGELAHLARNRAVQLLHEKECRSECQLYDLSGDETHLWRAWRIARAIGNLSPKCLALLGPRLDGIAARPRNPIRANQRRTRNDALMRYYDLLEAGENKTNARRSTARERGTTEGAMKQRVLEHEMRTKRKR